MLLEATSLDADDWSLRYALSRRYYSSGKASVCSLLLSNQSWCCRLGPRSIDDISKGCPVRLDILRVKPVWLQLAVQLFNQWLVDMVSLHLWDVDQDVLEPSYHVMWAPGRLYPDVEFWDQQGVVCSALCAAHGFDHVLPIPLPDDEVMQQVPVLGVRMLTSRLVTAW